MKKFYVSIFCGWIENLIRKEEFISIVKKLIAEHDFIEFLISNDNYADVAAAYLIRKIFWECHSDDYMLTLVLHNETKTLLNESSKYFNMYTAVEISSNTILLHNKPTVLSRNLYMIDRCDLIIMCSPNLDKCIFEYMKKTNKRIINLT